MPRFAREIGLIGAWGRAGPRRDQRAIRPGAPDPRASNGRAFVGGAHRVRAREPRRPADCFGGFSRGRTGVGSGVRSPVFGLWRWSEILRRLASSCERISAVFREDELVCEYFKIVELARWRWDRGLSDFVSLRR